MFTPTKSPIEILENLQQRCSTDYQKVIQENETITIRIYNQKTLIVRGRSKEDCADILIRLLKMLAKLDIQLSGAKSKNSSSVVNGNLAKAMSQMKLDQVDKGQNGKKMSNGFSVPKGNNSTSVLNHVELDQMFADCYQSGMKDYFR